MRLNVDQLRRGRLNHMYFEVPHNKERLGHPQAFGGSAYDDALASLEGTKRRASQADRRPTANDQLPDKVSEHNLIQGPSFAGAMNKGRGRPAHRTTSSGLIASPPNRSVADLRFMTRECIFRKCGLDPSKTL